MLEAGISPTILPYEGNVLKLNYSKIIYISYLNYLVGPTKKFK